MSVVTSSTYESFTTRDHELPKAILFSDKKGTPVVWKALSRKYVGKINMGIVKDSDKELLEKFNVKTFPKMVVLQIPSEYSGDWYESDKFEMKELTDFFRPYAYPSNEKKVQREIFELNPNTFKNGICGPKDTNFCLIFISDEGAKA